MQQLMVVYTGSQFQTILTVTKNTVAVTNNAPVRTLLSRISQNTGDSSSSSDGNDDGNVMEEEDIPPTPTPSPHAPGAAPMVES